MLEHLDPLCTTGMLQNYTDCQKYFWLNPKPPMSINGWALLSALDAPVFLPTGSTTKTNTVIPR